MQLKETREELPLVLPETRQRNGDYPADDASAAGRRERLTDRFRDGHRQTSRGLFATATVAAEFRDCYGYASYVAWVKDEFDLSERTADSLLAIHKNLIVTAKFAVEDFAHFAPSALTLLAAPSTPAEVVQEAKADAQAGKKVTHKKVKAAKEKAAPKEKSQKVSVKRVEPAPTIEPVLEPETPVVVPVSHDLAKHPLATQELRQAFERRPAFTELTTAITKLKQSLHALANEPVGAYIDPQEIDHRTRDVRNLVTYATPYSVCQLCGGKGCNPCKHTGWMPEKLYYQVTPEGDQ